jgi:hydroxymethylbilane synthase
MKHASLAKGGTKGLFVKEIEEALANGFIDLAVHSLKDLPVAQPEGLYLAAIPAREDARDVLVSQHGEKLAELPAGARVGTSSVRRQAQLRSVREDLETIPVRGNLDTRVAKMARGACEGLVLAAAGLRRLGLQHLISQTFSVEEMCPAPGQGALAIEIRRNDDRAAGAVSKLDDRITHLAVLAERAALRQLGGGCQTPIGIHSRIEDRRITVSGVVSDAEGTQIVRASVHGTEEEAESTGERLALELIRAGAGTLLEGRD